MRDTQLDIYRALLMMYIPCVIHVMYWLMDGREPYLSLLLFEMPMVYFVSGAAFSVSCSRRGLWSTVMSRLRRVVFPYYIYALVLLAVGAILWFIGKVAGAPQMQMVDLSQYSWKDLALIALCRDIPQFPYIWHLWFIPPYLILSCTFPLQLRLMKRLNSAAYFAVCLLVFLVAQAVTGINLIRQVLGYNVFMVAGYLFYRRISNGGIALVGLAALAALLGGVFWGGADFFPMQGHKFPPDWIFVLYGLLVLCLLSLVLGNVKLKSNRLLKLWSERGYHIYLYQSVVFTIMEILRTNTLIGVPGSPLVRALVDAVIVFLLSTGLSLLTYPLERAVINKIKLGVR
jgi:surface polysaccharide O-acyltransferase-like enzyme